MLMRQWIFRQMHGKPDASHTCDRSHYSTHKIGLSLCAGMSSFIGNTMMVIVKSGVVIVANIMLTHGDTNGA